MIYNTTSAEVIEISGEVSPYYATLKQFLFAMASIFASLLVYRLGYHWFVDNSPYLFVSLIILLLFVFVPPLGMQINGACRWINVMGISLQPSEFMKLVLPMMYIYLYSIRKGKLTFPHFVGWQVILLIPVGLILMEPDTGTAFILLATLGMLYFITRIRLLYWVVPGLIVLGIGSVFALSMTHVSERLKVYLDPESDLLGRGHQPYQAKIAAGSGGLYGKGLGESMQKYHYLPEARSDYIAAIFAEEVGFVGILALMTTYMIFAVIGFTIASRAVDEKGYYLASIYTFIIVFQAFLNLGVVSGLLPSKGTNLPFFSQGGSSFLAHCMMIAIIFGVHHHKKVEKTWLKKLS